jgi:glycosyltransferase involved in cell wall biosynthesis
MLNDETSVPGGHRVQASKTAAALRAIGVDLEIGAGNAFDFSLYDVVHAFGISRNVLRAARCKGAAIAVSPIWWSADYVTGQTTSANAVSRLVLATRIGASVLRRGTHVMARRIRSSVEDAAMMFELADVLLPNSKLEAEQIRADTGTSTPMRIVPNGVDLGLFTPAVPGRLRSGVLCVGRLEPHKNQLGLIEELKGTGIPLTLVGTEHPHHSSYAARCRAAAGANVRFISGCPHESLPDIYRTAAVHVLPSWFETTGLVSLEAAASGCAIVTTIRGYAKEYFGDFATYCDPGKRGSIRTAVKHALATPAPSALRASILANFTWAHAAAATLAAYEQALGR